MFACVAVVLLKKVAEPPLRDRQQRRVPTISRNFHGSVQTETWFEEQYKYVGIVTAQKTALCERYRHTLCVEHASHYSQAQFGLSFSTFLQ